MNDELSSESGRELGELLDAVLEGTGGAENERRLAQLLRDHPAARQEYVRQVRLHAMLQWRSGHVQSAGAEQAGHPVQLPSSRMKIGPVWTGRLAMAAAVAVGVGLAASMVPRWIGSHAPRGVSVASLASLGEVVEVQDVIWSSGQLPLTRGSHLTSGMIAIDAGTLGFRSEGGAHTTVKGPARIQLISNTRLVTHRGRVTVRANHDLPGFTVETATANVVDLGTEFGVEVDATGRTNVVVFDGAVDVSSKAGAPTTAPSDVTPQRLTKGEGVSISREGRRSRIVAVDRKAGDPDWTVGPKKPDPNAVIESVWDNIVDTGAGKYYQIVRRGLGEDVAAYVDRDYEWNGVNEEGMPAFLVGADLVQTFNDDKRNAQLSLTLKIAQPAMLYVFLYENATPPQWLINDFSRTGKVIGLDEHYRAKELGKGPGQSIDRVFSIWEREITKAGEVTLGSNDAKSMYGIAAVPMERKPE